MLFTEILARTIHPVPAEEEQPNHARVDQNRSKKRLPQRIAFIEDVEPLRHAAHLRCRNAESVGAVTILTSNFASPSSATICAIGSQGVSLSARTYTAVALWKRARTASASA